MNELLSLIATDLGLLPSEIQDTNQRSRQIVLARRIFSWAGRTLTSHTFQSLAQFLLSNQNSHSTIIDAYYFVLKNPDIFEPYAVRLLHALNLSFPTPPPNGP